MLLIPLYIGFLKDLRAGIAVNNVVKVAETLSKIPKNMHTYNQDFYYRIILLLMEAEAIKAQQKIIILLIDFLKSVDFDLNDINFQTYSVLKHVFNGNVESVESFLKKVGEKIDSSLLDLDLLVNCVLHKKNNNRSRQEMLQLLIQYGFDINYKYEKKENLLHRLIQLAEEKDDNDAIQTAEFLLNSGFSVHKKAKDSSRRSPLDIAALTQNIPFLSFLIENGAGENENTGLVSPLCHACMFHYKEVVDFLLSKGADINCKNKNGSTPLYESCSQHNDEMINFLISKGADVNVTLPILGIRSTPFSLLRDPDEADPNDDDITSKDQYNRCVIVMVKEFAKLSFKNIPISKTNYDLIQKKAPEHFEKCVLELKQMASTKFYIPHSFYSILNKSIDIKNLAYLTTNDELSHKFEECSQKFSYYKNDLKSIWEEAVQVSKKF